MARKLTNRLAFAAAPLAMLLFTACGDAGDTGVTQTEDQTDDQEMVAADDQADADAVEISLTAEGREFFFEGDATPNPDIVVQEGDTVEVTLCVTGGSHDWTVDEFDAATDMVSEGDECSTVEFVADEVGEFEYYCSVGNHREEGMVGLLIVEAADDAE
jgi:plastocyanin